MQLRKEMTSLEIEPSKTKTFSFTSASKIKKIDLQGKKQCDGSWFDYLGFVFDGDVVQMREKGVYKFHYKSKQAINRFLRIEYDRQQIKTKTVPIASNKQRLVWKSGQQIMVRTFSTAKQRKYIKRILQTKQGMNYNLVAAKVATRMYLVGSRYGEGHSMIGYAKRAQKIMSDNSSRYRVNVLNQILRQLRVNQKRVQKIRNL